MIRMVRWVIVSMFLLLQCGYVPAATEVLRTSKVKVGEKAPLTDSLKKAHGDRMVIVLVLLPNPMQCNGCDKLERFIQEEAARYTDMAFIVKGGQDMLGAVDEETIALKRLYGFVTVGEPWTFIIDKEGVLRGIFIGPIGKEELRGIMDSIIGGKI